MRLGYRVVGAVCRAILQPSRMIREISKRVEEPQCTELESVIDLA